MTILKTYYSNRGKRPILAYGLPTGNPTDGGWALIDMESDDYNMIAWEPAAGEGDPDYGKLYTVYQLGDPHDVSDWAKVKDIARSMDLDPDELLAWMQSDDVRERAAAWEAVASYYGWGELSAGYSETEDVFQMISQFGEGSFDEPELEIDYEDLGQESGFKISGPDYQGFFEIVEWGWVEPDEDGDIQRVEYTVSLDDMFKGRPGELESLLLLSDPEEQAELVVAAARRVERQWAQGDVSRVEEVGD